jgi:hypothetical protein
LRSDDLDSVCSLVGRRRFFEKMWLGVFLHVSIPIVATATKLFMRGRAFATVISGPMIGCAQPLAVPPSVHSCSLAMPQTESLSIGRQKSHSRRGRRQSGAPTLRLPQGSNRGGGSNRRRLRLLPLRRRIPGTHRLRLARRPPPVGSLENPSELRSRRLHAGLRLSTFSDLVWRERWKPKVRTKSSKFSFRTRDVMLAWLTRSLRSSRRGASMSRSTGVACRLARSGNSNSPISSAFRTL